MAARRRQGAEAFLHWLRVGAVAVGVGAALTAGHGIAVASPSDSADHGDDGAQRDVGSPSGSPVDGQDSGPDPADGSSVGAHTMTPVGDRTSGHTVPGTGPTRLAKPSRPDAILARHRDRVRKSDDPTFPLLRAALSDALTPASPETASAPTTLAETAPEVTLNSIGADVLTRVGWGKRLPLPAVPLPTLVETMWLVVRQKHHAPPAAGASNPTGRTALDPAALTDLLGRPGVSVTLTSDGTIDVIVGAFTDTTVTSGADAARLLNELAPLLGAHTGFADADDISIQRVGQVDATPVPQTFYRLRETVYGVPVLGSEVILVTDADGHVTGLFNHHDPYLDAIHRAPDARMDDYAEAVVAAATTFFVSAISHPRLWPTLPFVALSGFDPQLVVYSLDPDAPARLAWQVSVEPFGRLEFFGLKATRPGNTYFIAANGADAGAVLMATSNASDLGDPTTTTGTDLLGQLRTINVQRRDLMLFHVDKFIDHTRQISTYQYVGLGYPLRLQPDIVEIRGAIPVFAANFIPFLPKIPIVRDIPVLGSWLGGWNPSAVSGQANMALVYDYYQNVLGRNSFDDDGAPLTVLVDYNPGGPLVGLFWQYKNAYWSPGEQMMVFGDSNFAAAVDVVGHEYTHAVVTYVVGGLNGGESGAMNEAYADILGNLIEGKSDAGRWLVSEDTGEVLRDMADPGSVSSNLGAFPDHYTNRYTGIEDDGGVHQNSTIFSHAAYLMMTDLDPATSNIPPETWAKIFYRSLYALSPGAQFTDGRAAIVFTAQTEFGFDAAQLAVIEKAFDDVGIA